jgi:hypothetical protein
VFKFKCLIENVQKFQNERVCIIMQCKFRITLYKFVNCKLRNKIFLARFDVFTAGMEVTNTSFCTSTLPTRLHVVVLS